MWIVTLETLLFAPIGNFHPHLIEGFAPELFDLLLKFVQGCEATHCAILLHDPKGFACFV